MNLHRRLRLIEESLATRPCPECGAGDDTGEPRFVWVRPEDADRPCGTCGRARRVIRMRPVRIGDSVFPHHGTKGAGGAEESEA